MSSNISSTTPEEISLRDSLHDLVQKWWLILGVLVACVALAFIATSFTPKEYEARTRLLIVPRVQQTLLGNELSVEALSTLATARDLMRSIIAELNLKENTGEPWSVEKLAMMLTPTVETAGRAGLQTSLPLLTVTVKGSDREQVQKIAETWGTLFVEQNVQLFATEAANSYDFLASQYVEVDKERAATQNSKLEYTGTHPTSLQKNQLKTQTMQYEEFTSQLATKQASLIGKKAQLERAQQEIASQPQFITTKRSVSNDALVSILANNPNQRTVDALPELTVEDQQPNPLYTSLKRDISEGQITIARLTAEIGDLSSRTSALGISIVDLTNKIDVAESTIADFDRRLELLNNNVETLAKQVGDARLAKAEQRGIIRIVEKAIEPNAPIAKHRIRIIIAGATIGLLLGVLIAIVVNYLMPPKVQTKKA